MKHKTFTEQCQLLESHNFEKLCIIRSERECYLLIKSDGREHILAGKNTTRYSFRHVRQMKAWLKSNFQIADEDIEYRNFEKDRKDYFC